MAVVKYTDAAGVERWADEHSKAYEKHLKESKAAVEATPAEVPAAKAVTDRPAEAKTTVVDPKAASEPKKP